MADDGTGEIEYICELVALDHVLEGAGIVFGRKQVVAVFEPKAFADVFEGVGVGPTDTDGFFSERDGLPALIVDGFFGLNPGDLVREEVFGEAGVGI